MGDLYRRRAPRLVASLAGTAAVLAVAIVGMLADPNRVWSDPRDLDLGPPYPRLANLYLHGSVNPAEIPSLARWDVLILDSVWSRQNLQQLRTLNPDIKLFFYVCSQCLKVSPPPPDAWRQTNLAYAQVNDLWWRNANRSIASDWPGTQLLNMTDLAAAGPQGTWRSYIAQRIQLLMLSRPELDGVFLDNYWKSISWEQGKNINVDSDCNPSHNPSGCNGVPDNRRALDVLWNNALRELARDLRQRFDAVEASRGGAPLAILTNSASDYFPWVNGTLYEKFPSRNTPADAGNQYGYNWNHEMRAYGSGYLVAPFSRTPYKMQIVNASWTGTYEVPDRSADFERHKRFTLVSALLGDGYYSLDQGTSHGGLWWEPEFDGGGIGQGYLGQALGPVRRIGFPNGREMITNGTFTSLQLPWQTLASGCNGSYRLDYADFHSAPASARLEVANLQPGGSLKLYQSIPLLGGNTYSLSFWARASAEEELLVHVYSPTCANERCLDDQRFTIGTSWERYEVSFIPSAHTVAGLNIFVNTPGTVWVDDVSVRFGDTSIYRRDFENGIVLLNYTSTQTTVPLGQPFYRLRVPGSSVWDGAVVLYENIPPSDARILLRHPPDAFPKPGEGQQKGTMPPIGQFRLWNDPSPFGGTTNIRFALDRDEPVKLAVYDVAGRLVRNLVDAPVQMGVPQAVQWDATDESGQHVAPGVYFYKLTTPTRSESRKTVRLQNH